jgi:hypothetical protein
VSRVELLGRGRAFAHELIENVGRDAPNTKLRVPSDRTRMNEPTPQDPRNPLEILRKLQLTVADVHAHVIDPPHVRDSRVVVDSPTSRYPTRSGLSQIFSILYTLNTDKLAKALHNLLSPCLMGYALELRSYGKTVFHEQWHFAKSYQDGPNGWDFDTPMHLASTSKLITAMAMTQLLRDHKISFDDRIEPWLPQYWRRGGNIQNLTFRHLLAHTSGLFAAKKNDPGPFDYQSIKDAISLGTTDLATYDYKNGNYTLCRVLLATINGDAVSIDAGDGIFGSLSRAAVSPAGFGVGYDIDSCLLAICERQHLRALRRGGA